MELEQDRLAAHFCIVRSDAKYIHMQEENENWKCTLTAAMTRE
jgi:hypothetical protein